MKNLPVIVGITGASGALYAHTLVKELVKRDVPVEIVTSKWGRYLLNHELNFNFGKNPQKFIEEQYGKNVKWIDLTWHPGMDMSATIASGTYRTRGMVVVPMSMGTLGHISNGVTSNLLHRAADVTLKEKRPLILVPRETPLSQIHLDNLLKVSKAGATIVDANPTFYQGAKTIQDLIDSVVARILDSLGIDNKLVPEWGIPKEFQDA